MGLTDNSRKVQQFKELNWRCLLKTCDILLEQSGKSGGLPFEQSGKSRGLELEQSGKSRGKYLNNVEKHGTYYLNNLANLNNLTNLEI